jgi:hypothetical protein
MNVRFSSHQALLPFFEGGAKVTIQASFPNLRRDYFENNFDCLSKNDAPVFKSECKGM